jgi:putative membrane protein
MKKLMPVFFLMFLPFVLVASANGNNGSYRGYGMGPGMMTWGYGMGWFGSIFMFLVPIAFIVAIIFLIRWLIVSTGQSRETGTGESALDILKKRYARGEIDRDEFEEKKKDLAS